MRRKILPLSTLDDVKSPIAAVLALWRAARPADGLLPASGAFQLGELLLMLDDAGWVGVKALTPARFEFHALDGMELRTSADLLAVARHGGALRDHARPVYDDYAAAAFMGVPLLHRLLDEDASEDAPLERLILPFASDGIGVDGLLVCAAARNPATLH